VPVPWGWRGRAGGWRSAACKRLDSHVECSTHGVVRILAQAIASTDEPTRTHMKRQKVEETNGSKFAIRAGPTVGFKGVRVNSNNPSSRLENGMHNSWTETRVPRGKAAPRAPRNAWGFAWSGRESGPQDSRRTFSFLVRCAYHFPFRGLKLPDFDTSTTRDRFSIVETTYESNFKKR
jgi:hypothetical protein